MEGLNLTFFVQMANFLLILFLLNWILFRPIRGIIRERSETMAHRLEEAENFSAAAEEKLSQYEASLQEARKEGSQIRMTKKGEGQEEEKVKVEKAGTEAVTIVQEARKEVAKQKEAALSSLKGQVEGLATKATSKVLGQA